MTSNPEPATRRVTMQDVEPLVVHLLKEYGEDYVYLNVHTQCYYFGAVKDSPMSLSRDDVIAARVPWCFVGQIASQLGASPLTCAEGLFDGTQFPELEFDDQSILYLRVAQSVQDSGGSWGIGDVAGRSALKVHFKQR